MWVRGASVAARRSCSTGLDVQVADPLDARLVQQPEREDQVGVGVGVDPVAGQRGRQHQARRHARRGVAQVGEHPGGEGDEVVGDGPHERRTLPTGGGAPRVARRGGTSRPRGRHRAGPHAADPRRARRPASPTSALDLAVDPEVDPGGPLAQPLAVAGREAANRFCVLPMEGWDGGADGAPDRPGAPALAAVRRRRRRASCGPRHRGAPRRAGQPPPAGHRCRHGRRPRRAAARPGGGPRRGRRPARRAGRRACSSPTRAAGAGPTASPRPRIAYRHPLLDGRVGLGGPAGDAAVLHRRRARRPGRRLRAGRGAGPAGRVRLRRRQALPRLPAPRAAVRRRPARPLRRRPRRAHRVPAAGGHGIRAEAPGLGLALRLSAFDVVPHARRARRPAARPRCDRAVGLPLRLRWRRHRPRHRPDRGRTSCCAGPAAGASTWCRSPPAAPTAAPTCSGRRTSRRPTATTRPATRSSRSPAWCGSPPSWPRPTPSVTIVASGLSYLQQWLPHAGQALVAAGGAAAVGYGRMALSYPHLPHDVLAGRPLDVRQHLPHAQRLHHRPPPGPGVGLLPLRRLLQGPARARRAGGGQAGGRAMTHEVRTVDGRPARGRRCRCTPGSSRTRCGPTHLAALAEVADLLDPEAVQALPADRADEVLAAADVLLGHWGCVGARRRVPGPGAPAADAGLRRRDRARHRDPARRSPGGLLVTSGAAANAVPVAEYTVAAILWANKAAFTEREQLRGADAAGAAPPASGRQLGQAHRPGRRLARGPGGDRAAARPTAARSWSPTRT